MDALKYSQIFIDDGLGEKAKSRYKKRRQLLAETAGHLLVIYGLQDSIPQLHHWEQISPFIFQEPAMIYLTGVNQLETALILDPWSKTDNEILFLPAKDAKAEFWNGLKFGTGTSQSEKEACSITGVSKVMPIKELDMVIMKKLKQRTDNRVGLFWNQPNSKKQIIKDTNYFFKNRLRLVLNSHGFNDVKFVNISNMQWAQRIPFDRVSLKNMRSGQKMTANAFNNTMKAFKTFHAENEVSSYLDHEIARHSYYKNSFPTIAASTTNATILHYTKNNAALKPGTLLLLDFGLRWHSITTDISRTIPINGTFDPMQKLLYQIVLDTQTEIEKITKAGIRLMDLDKHCWKYMNDLLQKQFINKGGSINLLYGRSPHKVGHLIGLQTHEGDPYGDYRNKPLPPNCVISNEPGLYGHFEISLHGHHYNQTLGIRIEDNLLITPKGCVNLSKAIPKKIHDLEALIK
ncbi:aminopeptidase P N-terminal domain-containing protein [Thermoproteota archaeon]